MLIFYLLIAVAIIEIIIALRLITKDNATDQTRKQGYHMLFIGAVILIGMIVMRNRMP